MKTNKSIESIATPVVIIMACFALGILDMFMLRGAVDDLLRMGPEGSSLIAFGLATVANFSAFLWGKAKGEHSDDRKLGKRKARASFLVWVAIGLVYMLFRAANIYDMLLEGSEITDIVGGCINAVMLAILYIGTGTSISESAERIFDTGARACRLARKAFMKVHKKVPQSIKSVSSSINILQSYDKNYEYLNAQAAEIYSSIAKYEKAALADSESRILAKHQGVDPVDLNNVKKQVLLDVGA